MCCWCMGLKALMGVQLVQVIAMLPKFLFPNCVDQANLKAATVGNT
jgi:hypothetical protein